MASVIRGSDNFDSVYAKPKAQCTAWVNFDGTTTPPTIRDSYNVSSVVRTATGVYQIYFTAPMDNVNYSSSCTIDAADVIQTTTCAVVQSGGGSVPKSINSFTVASRVSVGSVYDQLGDYKCNVNIFGGKNV